MNWGLVGGRTGLTFLSICGVLIVILFHGWDRQNVHGTSPTLPPQRKTRAVVENDATNIELTVVKLHSTSGDATVDIVPKTVYSSKLRFIYLVGLEGTGHHYMSKVLDHMCTTSSFHCPNICAMATASYPGLGNPQSAEEYKLARKELRKQMEALAVVAENIPKGQAEIAAFYNCFESGMMSYPNFNGKDKSLQYVDFRILAEEAELAGVDLRIIYLSRTARDIVIADTKHRKFGETPVLEIRALLSSADTVASTFRELEPSFTICSFFNEIQLTKNAERVANFAAPTQNTASRFAQDMVMIAKEHNATKNKPPYKYLSDPENGVGMLVARLQLKLDALNKQVCSQT